MFDLQLPVLLLIYSHLHILFLASYPAV